MDLSIIVPIGKNLQNCKIDSWLDVFLKKNYPIDIEMIIIEDTLPLDLHQSYKWRYFAKEKFDIKIKILESSCENPGCTRNKGLLEANGNWIIFWDNDDIPALEPIVSKLSKNKKDLVDAYIFGYSVVDAKNSKQIKTKFPSSKQIDQIACNPGIWRILFRRKFINSVLFPNLLLGEDRIFLSRLDWKNANLVCVNEIAYYYFTNQNNQLTNVNIIPERLELALKFISNDNEVSNNLNNFEKITLIHLVLSYLKRVSLHKKIRMIYLVAKKIFDKPKKYLPVIQKIPIVVIEYLDSR